MLKKKFSNLMCLPVIFALLVFIDENNADGVWPTVPDGRNPFYSFSMPRNNFAIWIPPVVTQFKSQVLNEVQRSPKLTSALRSLNQAPSLLWSDSMFYIFSALAAEQAMEDPGSIGVLVTKNVQKTGYLSGDVILAAEVTATAKYLLNRGFLNDKNSAEFAHAYVKHLSDSVKQIAQVDYLATNAAAITLGLVGFINTETPAGVEDTKQIGELLSNEILIQGMATTDMQSSNDDRTIAIPKTSLRINDDACWQKIEPVELFHQSLLNSVRSSPRLRDLFNLGAVITPAEYRIAVFFLSLYKFHALYVSDAAMLAQFVSRFVIDVPSLSLENVVSVFGRSIGKFLVSQDVIHNYNVIPKVKRYIHILEEAAKAVINSKIPRTNAIALSLATKELFMRLNIDPFKVKEFIEISGNEFRCLSLFPSNIH